MERVLELHKKEQLERQQFRETLSLRECILQAKNNITRLEIELHNDELKMASFKQEIVALQGDVVLTNKSLDEMNKQIKYETNKTLQYEVDIRNSKQAFENFLRESLNKADNYLKHLQDNTEPNPIDNLEDNFNRQNIISTLKGEIEALNILIAQQMKQIEEMNIIESKLENLFMVNPNH
ncbi:hypothetical protein ABEB36_008890 [Hypothenemus hampei]|uniref:Uncharacterized protein n=1 Tax=Hypothenemus hampei TaxID=57062 RepID=A0ABD1EQK8_HYPHA